MFEEKIIWHEVTTRPLTEEEENEYIERGCLDYETPEYMFTCEMPEDGQDILVALTSCVHQDCCMIDDGSALGNEYFLESLGDWDGVKAWAAMPKYKGSEDSVRS